MVITFMDMKTGPKRIMWLDIAKGIAIILMVTGHISGIPSSLRGIIFSFHMPLFMIINGYLIRGYNIKDTFRKSCNSLLKPYIIVCIIQAFISACLAPDNNRSGQLFFAGLDDMVLGLSRIKGVFTGHGSVWLIWFVICLFFARNMYVAIQWAFRNLPAAVRCLVIIGVAAAGYVIGTYYAFLPWSLDVAMVSVVFIAVGDIIRRKNIIEGGSRIIALCSLVVWGLFLSTGTYIELAERRYPLVVGGIICAIAGSVFILFVSRFTETKLSLFSGILSWYGKNSLLILSVHCIEMRFIPWDKWIILPESMKRPWIVFLLIRFVFISICATAIIHCYKYFKYLGKDHCSERKPENGRMEWPDVARGICIIAVIAGHMGISFVNQLVFLWHLPVFFLLSGYFLRKSPFMITVKEKASRLLIPYYLTCLVICLTAVLKAFIRKQDPVAEFISWAGASLYAAGDSWDHPFKIMGIGAIWFLWALFIAIIITNFFAELKYAGLFIVLIAIAGWGSMELTGIWLPLSIQAGMLASLYLYIGYKARKADLELQKTGIIPGMIIGIAAAIGVQHFKGFWLVHDYMGNGWIDFLFSICASIVIMIFAGYISENNNMIKPILMFFGRNSLVILCLHIVELDVLPISKVVLRILSLLPVTINEPVSCLMIFIAKMMYVSCGVIALKIIYKHIPSLPGIK